VRSCNLALLTVMLVSLFLPKVASGQASINGVLYVGGGITAWGSGDIGSQINNAYIALGAAGGTIKVLCPVGGGYAYNYTTTIYFATTNKYPILQGDCGGSTLQLNYTPTSGAAIVLDYVGPAGSGEAPGAGLRDITFVNNNCSTSGGCGYGTTGLSLGDVGVLNGDIGAHRGYFENVRVMGFGTGVWNNAALDWGLVWTNCGFIGNGIGYYASVPQENTTFLGGTFAGNGTALDATGGGDFYLYGVSVDQSQTLAFNLSQSSFLECYGCHLENQNSSSHLATVSSAASLTLHGGRIFDGRSGSSADWYIQATGAGTTINLLNTHFASAKTSVASIIQANTNARAFAQIIDDTSNVVSAIFNGSSTNVSDFTMQGTNGGIAVAPLTEAGFRPGSVTATVLLSSTPPNGTMIYCSNCTITSACASGGNGAFAKRLNGVWVCN
jgi:hypothetical protein